MFEQSQMQVKVFNGAQAPYIISNMKANHMIHYSMIIKMFMFDFQNVDEAIILNYQQNMQDAISIMYKLQTGIDVNVRFTGYDKYFRSLHLMYEFYIILIRILSYL